MRSPDLPASLRPVRGRSGAVYIAPHNDRADIYFFTRLGGVSKPPFDDLNVSSKYGDAPEAVHENRRRVTDSIGGESAFVRQVAGDRVVRVNESGFAGEADGLITDEINLPLEVGVADCVPVALVGSDEVAMVHSGWRGTLDGIGGKAAKMMGASDLDADLDAYIGPCIRRCCYEVSEELAATFADRFGAEVVSGRHLSLVDSIEADLRSAGVRRIHDTGLCTGCRGDLFFSHRMQKPVTGRSLAVIVRRDRGSRP